MLKDNKSDRNLLESKIFHKKSIGSVSTRTNIRSNESSKNSSFRIPKSVSISARENQNDIVTNSRNITNNRNVIKIPQLHLVFSSNNSNKTKIDEDNVLEEDIEEINIDGIKSYNSREGSPRQKKEFNYSNLDIDYNSNNIDCVDDVDYDISFSARDKSTNRYNHNNDNNDNIKNENNNFIISPNQSLFFSSCGSGSLNKTKPEEKVNIIYNLIILVK
jgi:hypothetical protein